MSATPFDPDHNESAPGRGNKRGRGRRRPEGKLYYRIGEVAKMLNVTTSLIRYWESEFPHLKPKKNRSGTRYFTAKEIEQLQYIHYMLKDQGHTIQRARKLIRQKRTDEAFRYSLVQRLEIVRSFLSELRRGLN